MAKKKPDSNNKVKKTSGESDKNDKTKVLQADLAKLAKEINEQGLAFLIKQAQTLINNMKISQANREKTAGKISVKGANVKIFLKEKIRLILQFKSPVKGNSFQEMISGDLLKLRKAEIMLKK